MPRLFNRHSEFWIPFAVFASLPALIGLNFSSGILLVLNINFSSIVLILIAGRFLRRAGNSLRRQAVYECLDSSLVLMNNFFFQLFFFGLSGIYGFSGVAIFGASLLASVGFLWGLFSYWRKKEAQTILLFSDVRRMNASLFANKIVSLPYDGSWVFEPIHYFFPFLPRIFRRFLFLFFVCVSVTIVSILWVESGRIELYIIAYCLAWFYTIPRTLFWMVRVLCSYSFIERCKVHGVVRSDEELEFVFDPDFRIIRSAGILA